MKNSYKQISAFLFALLVIGSTTATAMSFHLCGGEVTSTALYKEAKSCGMHHHTPKSDKPYFSKKSCCFNDTVSLNSSNAIVVEKHQQFEPLIFNYLKTIVIVEPSDLLDSDSTSTINNHSPPLRKNALFKIYQVYRI